MTDRDMEQLSGEKVTAKHQMIVIGDQVYSRNGPNDWFRCDSEPTDFVGERAIVKLRADGSA